MRVRARAPAKVNLCLFLGPTRGDGRHELVTLFESVSLTDELSMSLTSGVTDEVICPGVEGENLALSALKALRARGWRAPPVRVEIEKRIPIAAGMAGGSADAAAVLRMAAQLAPCAPGELAEIAALLGADVPSQLVSGLVLGTGAGEIVEPLPPIAPHSMVIVPQREFLSTQAVYRHADRLALPREPDELGSLLARLRSALAPGRRLLPELLVNDLEPAAVSLCPPLSGALAALRRANADQTLVCGSGPTAAGIYWGCDGVSRARVAAAAVGRDFPGTTVAVPITTEFGAPEPDPRRRASLKKVYLRDPPKR
jgi:4-diphosphocytidyl-2-C-methyl-D-erythritol kinase